MILFEIMVSLFGILHKVDILTLNDKNVDRTIWSLPFGLWKTKSTSTVIHPTSHLVGLRCKERIQADRERVAGVELPTNVDVNALAAYCDANAHYVDPAHALFVRKV